MNFIERAVKALEQAEIARRAGVEPQATVIKPGEADSERDFAVPDTVPAQSPGTAENVRRSTDTAGGATVDGIPVLGEDAATESPGATFTRVADPVRAARMRALRDRIDQVEASDEQADVSLPAAPVRAARAAAAAAAGLLAPAGTSPAPPTAVHPLAKDPVARPAATRVAVPPVDPAATRLPPETRQENRLARAALIADDRVANAGVAGQSADASTIAQERVAGIAPVREGAPAATSSSSETATPSQADAPPEASPAERVAPSEPNGARPPAALRLEVIRASAYGNPNARGDPMRAAFETITDDLLDEILASSEPPTPAARRVVVTSAQAGEGRSLCSMHLALSLAVDQEVPVIWIDADCHGKPLLDELGVARGPGLADWLGGRVHALDEVIVHSDVAALRLVGIGSAEGVSAQGARIDQPALHTFLLALSQAYPDDIVVICAPPLLVNNEAMQIATLSGQAVVVVAADETNRATLSRALTQLERHAHVSLLLNKVAA